MGMRKILLVGGPMDGELVAVTSHTDRVMIPTAPENLAMFLSEDPPLEGLDMIVGVYTRPPGWKRDAFYWTGYEKLGI